MERGGSGARESSGHGTLRGRGCHAMGGGRPPGEIEEIEEVGIRVT